MTKREDWEVLMGTVRGPKRKLINVAADNCSATLSAMDKVWWAAREYCRVVSKSEADIQRTKKASFIGPELEAEDLLRKAVAEMEK